MPDYQLIFYVPLTHLESVKLAVFEAGAGQLGDYSHCCFETLGRGQFKPMQGAKPFIGERGEIEFVEEAKVEMVCSREHIKEAVKALQGAHPYEEPAFHVVRLERDVI